MHNTPNEKSGADVGTAHYHAVVWLDHHEAKVVHFNMRASEEQVVRPADSRPHLHTKAGSASGTHIKAEPAFYRDIATARHLVPGAIGPVSARSTQNRIVGSRRRVASYLNLSLSQMLTKDSIDAEFASWRNHNGRPMYSRASDAHDRERDTTASRLSPEPKAESPFPFAAHLP